jgi:transposase-like protein
MSLSAKKCYEKALRLRETFGYSYYRIAKMLGISPNTVKMWLYKGAKPKRKLIHPYNWSEQRYGHYWTQERVELLRALYPTRSKEEILNTFKGKSWQTIKKVASRFGIKRLNQSWRWQSKSPRVTITLNDYEKGWIEGIIDGEGTISLHKCSKRRFRPVVAFFNSNADLVEKFIKIIGKQNVSVSLKVKQGHNKPVYEVRLHRAVMESLLTQINLIAKSKQQKLLLEYLNLTSNGVADYSVLENIYKQIKELNQRNRNRSL